VGSTCGAFCYADEQDGCDDGHDEPEDVELEDPAGAEQVRDEAPDHGTNRLGHVSQPGGISVKSGCARVGNRAGLCTVEPNSWPLADRAPMVDGPEGPVRGRQCRVSQALGLLAAALLVLATAYFVMMEFSFTAASPNRLAEAADGGDRKAQASLRVLKRLSFCLSGAQLGITFAALLTGFVAEPVFAAVFEPALGLVGVPESSRGGVSLILGFLVSTFALMVLGELAPKNLAIAVPEQLARSLARSTLLFMRVGGPVIRLFDGAANALLKRIGITPIQESHGTVTAEDLTRIIDSAGSAGHLSPEETGLLGRALDFGDLSAGDVMVPRPRVVTLGEDARGAAPGAVARERALPHPSHPRRGRGRRWLGVGQGLLGPSRR